MSAQKYDIGDWIVHIEHGIGQITEKSEKKIVGEEKAVYKVETPTSIYSLPMDEVDADHVRPLASNAEMDQALALMQEPPHDLPGELKARETEIARVRQDISIKAKAQLIRDLHGESALDHISISEEFFLIKFKKEFLNELSAIKQKDQDQAKELMEKALATSVSGATNGEEGQ